MKNVALQKSCFIWYGLNELSALFVKAIVVCTCMNRCVYIHVEILYSPWCSKGIMFAVVMGHTSKITPGLLLNWPTF